jgi:pyruvate/2-oxoglutarate/acetoin dehydrogenase E1 component
MTRILTYAQAINEGMHQVMSEHENVVAYGLGIDDPKSIFGTTTGLKEAFGAQRVFDMPTSENAMTGVAIGAALNGIRSVMVHQRLDFFLLAMDQLVNSAAKWHFMFGGQQSVPIVIRLILGRGWGQGPTHSQNLQAWFAHIPGLRVVMPTSPSDAKGLLISSIFDNNPVVFLEHRWLHNTSGEVPEHIYRVPLGAGKIVRSGTRVTIVAMSYMTIEAIHAATYLESYGIDCEVIDLRSVKPIDWPLIIESVKKTGHLVALDTGHATGSVASEIVANISINCWEYLIQAPVRVAMPDYPEGTSFALTKNYHPRAEEIAIKIAHIFNFKIDDMKLLRSQTYPHDVPGDWFSGPF